MSGRLKLQSDCIAVGRSNNLREIFVEFCTGERYYTYSRVKVTVRCSEDGVK